MIAVKSITNNVPIAEVAEDIFEKRYFGRCLDCLFCDDMCCTYGCPVDKRERDRILGYASALEARLTIPASVWFEDEVIEDPDYPSGEAFRTRVYRNKCVFYNHDARGCGLHSFALEEGLDWRVLKPMVCVLFPLSWEEGQLLVSAFLDELPCRGQGPSVFEAQRDELRLYLGDSFVSELETRAVGSGAWANEHYSTGVGLIGDSEGQRLARKKRSTHK